MNASSPDDPDPLLDERALERPPDVEGGAIEGQVVDFDGVPLVGVRVEAAVSGGGDLDLLPTMTDGAGRFRLEGLADERYDLRFEVGRVAARTLGVPAGTLDLEVKLARPQGILLVAKTEPGAEVPDVLHVVLERQKGDARVREYVGRHLQTRLLLWSIRPGTYRVTVWGGAYEPVIVEGVRVEDGRPAPEVQVLLAAGGGRIAGRVDVPAAARADAVRVAWRRIDGEDPRPRTATSMRVDARGVFRVRGLVPGRYRVSAGTPEGPVEDVEIDVFPGVCTEIALDLR